MTPVVIGIDPGKKGGAALLELGTGELVDCFPFRTLDMAADGFAEWRAKYSIDHVLIEHVHAYPGQGVVSAFTFGDNFGGWKGILAAGKIRGHKLKFIEPRSWQRALGRKLPGHVQKTAHKNALKDLAAELYPQIKVTLATADALLIARHAALGL